MKVINWKDHAAIQAAEAICALLSTRQLGRARTAGVRIDLAGWSGDIELALAIFAHWFTLHRATLQGLEKDPSACPSTVENWRRIVAESRDPLSSMLEELVALGYESPAVEEARQILAA